jgi:geranylgeranyl diphosphate synthase type II
VIAAPAGFLERARALVDEALERHLPRPPDCPPLLSEAMRYSLFAGGKRLRPLLTLAAADAVRGNRAEADAVADALPAACAVELIHTYSLIHDDLPAMDNDTLRRGRPTLHVVYGDGIAILAGDGLQAEAFALIAREPVTSEAALVARKVRATRVIADAAGATGMVGGQTLDLQAAGQVAGHNLQLDPAALQAMHLRKTGALIRASAESGAVMGGGSEALIAAVRSWGAQVGLAFQIVDDILDVEGSSDELGKTAGKDVASNKPTYPSLFGLDRSRQMADECAARARDTLHSAGLSGSQLARIADWIVSRRS